MIAWTICVVIVIAIAATYRLVHHTGDRHQPRSLAVTLPARDQAITRHPVDGWPPWDDAPAPLTAPVAWTHDRDWECSGCEQRFGWNVLGQIVHPEPEPPPWVADLEAAGYDAHGGDLDAIAESCWTKGMGAELRAALAVNE